MTKLLTAKEVSEVLQIKQDRVWELTREQRLPFVVQLGDRQYRYSSEGLNRYIENGGNRQAAVNGRDPK